MPDFETHCAETLKVLGDRHEKVHLWLDELQPTLGPDHRKVRHNEKGIELVRKMWGDKAALAARVHINRDENSHVKVGGLWLPKDDQSLPSLNPEANPSL